MVNLIKIAFPEDKFETIYTSIKHLNLAPRKKKALWHDLGQLILGHYGKTYELEDGPSPAEIEKLLKQYEKTIKTLIEKTEILYPPLRCEESEVECSRIPQWLNPCFEKLESIANHNNSGEAQRIIKNIEDFRMGKKPRLHARTYWITELKKIYELQTGKKATANKNHPTDFTKFVDAFYQHLRHEGATKEHISYEIIYNIIK
jgi:hypothetical protein